MDHLTVSGSIQRERKNTTFFGFQAHSAPPEMTRKVRVRPAVCSLTTREGALAVFTDSSYLSSLNALDVELDNAPVAVCIYSEADPDPAELNGECISSKSHPSLEGLADAATVSSTSPTVVEDRISGSPRPLSSTPLWRCQEDRQLVLHELGFCVKKKRRPNGPLPK